MRSPTQLALLVSPDALNNTPAPARRGQPETAQEAARSVAGRTGSQKQAVLLALYAAGDYGLTDYDASIRCGIARPHAAATRRKSLMDDGLVEDSGRRRATDTGRDAVVWILSVEGRKLAAVEATRW